MIVTVTPNPSLDRTVYLDRLERGRVQFGEREMLEPSGKGVNVARALLANGHAIHAVLTVGGGAGQEIAVRLEQEGVPATTVPVAAPSRANVQIVEPDGTITKINTRGEPATSAELDGLLVATRAAVTDARWLVGAGSLPPGAEPGFYAAACRHAHAVGARFALDTTGRALAAALPAGPDVVKPNADELAEAVGRPVRTLGEATDGARVLLRRGARNVVVSLGPDGALLVSPDGVHHAAGRPAQVRSTVGAGDALLAGFVAEGGVGPAALRSAVAWATAAVGVAGSHVPRVTRADLDAIVVVADPADRPLADAGVLAA
ncbi:1-phosphofructokinase family hexose kinase [Patulibacter sp. SYSU D01012]|uniref:1-phosphofructokinase family hexose kinase n=1 Tax=Patulibacter sp. SYSU D01012 TaxID=2817381 RepID=UPI001B316438|nr:1-phosphofructokinase family hexose kinase [Patulibacter sp. SYSU D01012]